MRGDLDGFALAVAAAVEEARYDVIFGAAGYDSEGVPTRPVRLIENGKLARFRLRDRTGGPEGGPGRGPEGGPGGGPDSGPGGGPEGGT